MQNPILRKKLNDGEFERRSNRLVVWLLLMPVPTLLFAYFTYVEYGALPPVAVIVSAAAFVVICLAWAYFGRRDTLAAMRREGLIDEAYEPPNI